MSILAVKTYIADQAQTISLTGMIWKQVQSFSYQPKRGKAGGNIFVAAGPLRRREERLTSPRGAAEKRLPYEAEILLFAEHSNEQTGSHYFDVFVEAACQVYRSGVGNPTITDPITGAQSYLTDFGEEVDVDMLSSFFVGDDESRVAFEAVLTMRVTEVLTSA